MKTIFVLGGSGTWGHADDNSAARWMNSLPEGGHRDAAMTAFAPVAAKIDELRPWTGPSP